MEDVRAGLKARNIKEPQARVEAFLEARYGPLTEPANRQRAFLDFFNQDHIKGLNFIVSHKSKPATSGTDGSTAPASITRRIGRR